MTPAAELHAAAAKLRKRAEKVPPWARAEPWQVVQTDTENMDGVGVRSDWAIETYNENLAAYIATVHPGVGLLLADLLDGAAVEYLKMAGPNPGPTVERMVLAKVGGRELAVARAILGDTDQQQSAQPGTDPSLEADR